MPILSALVSSTPHWVVVILTGMASYILLVRGTAAICQVTIVSFTRIVVTYHTSKKAIRLARESQLPEMIQAGSEDDGNHEQDAGKPKKKPGK
ncbi:MAG TPA: hypothetical protein VF647_07220 [Longimicrobium sp.]|jgi:hypothetical protein